MYANKQKSTAIKSSAIAIAIAENSETTNVKEERSSEVQACLLAGCLRGSNAPLNSKTAATSGYEPRFL